MKKSDHEHTRSTLSRDHFRNSFRVPEIVKDKSFNFLKIQTLVFSLLTQYWLQICLILTKHRKDAPLLKPFNGIVY